MSSSSPPRARRRRFRRNTRRATTWRREASSPSWTLKGSVPISPRRRLQLEISLIEVDQARLKELQEVAKAKDDLAAAKEALAKPRPRSP